MIDKNLLIGIIYIVFRIVLLGAIVWYAYYEIKYSKKDKYGK